MINELKDIISKEKNIINLIKNNPTRENINSFMELNSKIPNLLYPPIIPEEILEPINQEIIIKKEKTVDSSFLTSKRLAMISNKLFRTQSEKVLPKFEKLSGDLKKGNISVLLQTYISIVFFITCFAFIFSGVVFSLLLISGIIEWIYFWIPFCIAGLIFGAFILYPGREASSIQKKINAELPFATIHMSAIAGSDMDPVKIFQIIAASKEYMSIGKELKKVLAQINIYGYDLLTALSNVSKTVSNVKLSELFSGLATNISSGGSLKIYLEKKSEGYLNDYKLIRKNYIEMAGTFMDIYISILIAAPLILMLMFIIMNVADLNVGGMSLNALLFLTIAVVAILNIVFMVVLNLKQPEM